MPITGFIMSAYENHPTKLFNLIPTPQLVAKNDKIADLFGNLHALGQWAIYALILLHIAGVVFHLVAKKDGVLGRMLPAQSLEG
jgi:cytochrome b561